MRPDTALRYHKNWKEISRWTISRRGNACEECGTSGQRFNPLTVHHKDYCPENNDASNLIVLCAACHLRLQQYEVRYGRNALKTTLDLFKE